MISTTPNFWLDTHDDVIKWKHFPRYWPFVRGIHRSPVNSPHKSQWREALVFTLSCARINGWVNNREAGDLRRYRPHYDVIVMHISTWMTPSGHQKVMIASENMSSSVARTVATVGPAPCLQVLWLSKYKRLEILSLQTIMATPIIW